MQNRRVVSWAHRLGVPLTAMITICAQVALAQTQTADYEIVFDATWSAATHPNDFPLDPHFSPLVGATHDASVAFWLPGDLASDGIEVMAETGGTGVLAAEVDVEITAGFADQLLIGSGLVSPGSTTLNVTVDRDHPLLTLVSMLAPSPDWFVGVHGLALFDQGWWVPEIVVDLHTYDAGSDLGTTFLSPDADAVPALPITLQGFPLEPGVPVGRLTIRRLPEPGLGMGLVAGIAGLSISSFRRDRSRDARNVRGRSRFAGRRDVVATPAASV